MKDSFGGLASALAVRLFFGIAAGALGAFVIWFSIWSDPIIIGIVSAVCFVVGFIAGRRALEWIWGLDVWSP